MSIISQTSLLILLGNILDVPAYIRAIDINYENNLIKLNIVIT